MRETAAGEFVYALDLTEKPVFLEYQEMAAIWKNEDNGRQRGLKPKNLRSTIFP